MTDAEGGGVASPRSTLAARIERLFEVSRPAKAPSRQWRNSEVVAGCRASGRDLSESHLSELRRGIKTNPTTKTLETIAWFFGIRVGYLVDDEVSAADEQELTERARKLDADATEAQAAAELEREAAQDLQRALRESGVTRVANRGARGNARQRAQMMQALARALRDGDADDSTPP